MASVPASLLDFTRTCLSQGVNRIEIHQALIDAGWTDREATAALESFAESPLPVPVPKKRVVVGLVQRFCIYSGFFFCIWLPSQPGPYSSCHRSLR